MPDAATSLVKGSNRKLDIRKYQQKDFFRGNRLFNFSTPSVCTIHHLDLPAELQLMTLSKLDLENLHNSKLVSKRFLKLANDDQLWRVLMLQAEIPSNILRDARGVCGINPSWQALYRSSMIIMRENERKVHSAFTQMKSKIDQVRMALERQTRVLEETHQRLEALSSRLAQMEEQGRVRDLERLRARQREEQRLDDERWIREWEECRARMAHAQEDLEENVYRKVAGVVEKNEEGRLLPEMLGDMCLDPNNNSASSGAHLCLVESGSRTGKGKGPTL
ncbi:hypothetical protein BG005_011763 [Podila minutissima]|nr:hypothetical protein BG005_011763 [Podila minutissima]